MLPIKTQPSSKNPLFRFITVVILCSFTLTTLCPSHSFAQGAGTLLNLPIPGVMVNPTPAYIPPILKGVKIYPKNPLRFDFILDTGDSKIAGEGLRPRSGQAQDKNKTPEVSYQKSPALKESEYELAEAK